MVGMFERTCTVCLRIVVVISLKLVGAEWYRGTGYRRFTLEARAQVESLLNVIYGRVRKGKLPEYRLTGLGQV